MAKWTPVDYPVGPLAGPSADADRPAPVGGSGTNLTHPLTLLLKGAGALSDVMNSPQVRTRLPHVEIEYAPGAAPTAPVLPAPQAAPPVPTIGPEIPPVNDGLFGQFLRAGMRSIPGLAPVEADRLADVFRLHVEKSWRENSLAGTAVTNIESGVNESPEALRRQPPGSSPYLGFTPPRRPGQENYMSFRPPEVQDRIAQRYAEKKTAYEGERAATDAQAKALGPLTPVEQIVSIFSSILGSAASPESAVGPARAAYSGASTLGKMALGAGTNAAVVAPSDLIAQDSAVARGDRKEINPAETALATGGAAALGALIPGIAALFRRAGALRPDVPGNRPDVPGNALDGEIIPPAPPGTPRLAPPEPGQPVRSPDMGTRVRMRDAPAELPPPVRQIEGQRALPAPESPPSTRQADVSMERPQIDTPPARPAEPATGPAIEQARSQPEVRVDADGSTIIRLPPPPEKPAKPAVAETAIQPSPKVGQPEAPAVDAPPVRAPAPSRSSLDNQGTVGEKAGMEQIDVPQTQLQGHRTSSWVIRNKETGDVVFETFDPKKVQALNTAKYEAVPAGEHLASLNRAPRESSQIPRNDSPVNETIPNRAVDPETIQPTRAAEQPPDVPDFLKRTPQPMREAPAPPVEKPVERPNTKYEELVQSIERNGGITREQAEKVLEVYRKEKLARIDGINGQIEIKHGAIMDRDVIRRAAGLGDEAPKSVEKPAAPVENRPIAEARVEASADSPATKAELEIGKEVTYSGRKTIEIRARDMDGSYVVESKHGGAKATEDGWIVKRKTTDMSSKYGKEKYEDLTPYVTKKEALEYAKRAAQDEIDAVGREGYAPPKFTSPKFVQPGDVALVKHGDVWRLGRVEDTDNRGVITRADVNGEKVEPTQKESFRLGGDELRPRYDDLMKRHGGKTWEKPSDAADALRKWKDGPGKAEEIKAKRAKPKAESDHPFSKDSKPTEMNLGLPLRAAAAKAVGPEAIGALVGGGMDHWQEHGYPGLTVKGMIAGAAAVAALRHRMGVLPKPVFGKTSYAKDALGAVGDAIGRTRAGRWFHPTMGLPKDLWDRIVVETGVETRNIQEAAKKVATHIRDNFTPAERALMSDWIERAEQQAHGINAFRAADARTKAQADALSAKADEIGQRLVDVGMLDKQSYDALKGAYLHRYYLPKQVADPGFREAAKRMQATATYAMRRGESAEFDAKGLKVGDTAVQWTNASTGNVTYRPAGTVPGADWFPSKEFKVEAVKDGRAVGHRDYTPAEREAMGEIRDANYRYTMGMMEAARDVALGSMFKDIAKNPKWASNAPQPDWVQVPGTSVQGTSVKKFGALAGMYVDPKVWSALDVVRKPWTNRDDETWNSLARSYTRALGLWKIGKTAYNPATHFNNVMGNVSLSMLTGETTPAFVMRGIGELRKAKRGTSAVVDEAKAAGLSLDREAHLGDAIDNLKADVGIATGMDPRTGWAKFADWFTNNGIVRAYQYEDSIFKLGSYMKNRAEGLSPREAVAKTHKVFFDYSDVPVGVQAVRDTYSPFFTYTYKYGQLLANIAAEKPWALLAAFGTLTTAHQMSYYHLYGERARANADYEAELMPKWLEGRSGFGAPKGIRLPWNEKDTVTGEPRSQFLNSRYMIPGGDFLDFTANGSFGPAVFPQMLGNTILGGNPLVNFAYSALSGKDSYFDKSIYPYKDPVNAGELAADAATIIRFAAAQALPPILMALPDKLGNAAVGEGALDKSWMTEAMGWTGTDFAGRQRSIIRAIGSGLGIKVEDVNPSENLNFKEAEAKKADRDANTEVRRAYNNESVTETRRQNLEKSAEDRAVKSDAELDRIYKLKKEAGR